MAGAANRDGGMPAGVSQGAWARWADRYADRFEYEPAQDRLLCRGRGGGTGGRGGAGGKDGSSASLWWARTLRRKGSGGARASDIQSIVDTGLQGRFGRLCAAWGSRGAEES